MYGPSTVGFGQTACLKKKCLNYGVYIAFRADQVHQNLEMGSFCVEQAWKNHDQEKQKHKPYLSKDLGSSGGFKQNTKLFRYEAVKKSENKNI